MVEKLVERPGLKQHLASQVLKELHIGGAIFGPNNKLIRANAIYSELNPDHKEAIYEALTRPIFHTEKGELSRLAAARVGMVTEADVCIDKEKGPWYKLKIFPGQDPRKILIIVRDASEEMDVEKQRQEELTVIAHGLKSPLNALLANAEFALDEYSNPTESGAKRLSGMLGNQVRMVGDTIRRINLQVELIRQSPLLRKEIIPITQIFDEIRTEKRGRIKAAGVKSRICHPNTDLSIKGDKTVLSAALENLIENAIQAMEDCCRKNLTITYEVKNGSIITHVKDTGMGISRENKDRVFTGITTKPRGGTGIGLPYSKRIVERHGGYLWLERSVTGDMLRENPWLEQTGTTFALSLPLYQEKG